MRKVTFRHGINLQRRQVKKTPRQYMDYMPCIAAAFYSTPSISQQSSNYCKTHFDAFNIKNNTFL